MTILGAIIEPDRCLLWSDTEVYEDQRPSGRAAKMSIHAFGIVTICGGYLSFSTEAAAVAQSAASIDQLEARLPAQLRRRAISVAPELTRRDEQWAAAVSVVGAGFSPRAGRMLGWRFDGAAFFHPVLFARHCAPSDAGVGAMLGQVASLAQLVKIARRQLALLRLRGIPQAAGGDLCIVEILPDAMRCWRLPDFDKQPESPPLMIEGTHHPTNILGNSQEVSPPQGTHHVTDPQTPAPARGAEVETDRPDVTGGPRTRTQINTASPRDAGVPDAAARAEFDADSPLSVARRG